MKRSILFILTLVLLIVVVEETVFAEKLISRGRIVFNTDTIIHKIYKKSKVDSSAIDSNAIKKVSSKNILQYLYAVDTSKRFISWKLNSKTYDIEEVKSVDTTMSFPHLFIPFENRFETFTSLGNIGAPIQSDHFFSRNSDVTFIFSKNYEIYLSNTLEQKQYFVRKPLTIIAYTSGGGSSIAEQTVRVVHSQNVNKYFNLGFTYEHYGTKGIYKRQTTKDNLFTLWGSYYRNRFSFQIATSYSRIRNLENGGVESDFYIQDTTIDAQVIPVRLKGAASEIKKLSFSGIAGYALINRWVKEKDTKGKDILVRKPVFTVKLIFDINKQTRTYTDTSTTFYKNYFINKGNTHDSTMLLLYQETILGEFEQLARFPGLPGLRFWITNTNGKYYYFRPTDFLYKRGDDKLNSTNIGAGIFSYSPYLAYNGALRMYLNGYRASDKELQGQILISPWKSTEYPYVKGSLKILDKEPDIFIKNYYSNNFKWNNNFDKEKWFVLSGVLATDKWRFEVGYNLARINNYIYFDTTALPKQAAGLTITSAYIQKEFKLGHFYSTNRVVWQAYDSKEIINLPKFSAFSSIFFEFELVKGVLNSRLGVNVSIRTKFYADAYSPATGQFYNQKAKEIGDYPVVDLFADFKWKRAVIFLKYEHINQGMPNNEYFSALHYPLNQRIFKFGVSWIFYD